MPAAQVGKAPAKDFLDRLLGVVGEQRNSVRPAQLPLSALWALADRNQSSVTLKASPSDM